MAALAGGDAAVDEDDVPVERDLDADEGVGVARAGARDDLRGDAVGEPVRMPGTDGLGKAEACTGGRRGRGFRLG